MQRGAADGAIVYGKGCYDAMIRHIQHALLLYVMHDVLCMACDDRHANSQVVWYIHDVACIMHGMWYVRHNFVETIHL